MRLATIRTTSGTAAVRIDGEQAVEVDAPDLGTLLARAGWQEQAASAGGARHSLADVSYAPLVPRPGKIICVGLNYRSHILEMGRELPDYPTLFAKFATALLGANDDIVLPAVSDQVDWEAELGVVIGTAVRRVSAAQAAAAIAGYTVVNDVSMRDWQWRTTEWLQGKSFEASTPVGPWLTTPDEVDAHHLDLSCEVDGDSRQHANTSDLLFTPEDIVAYVSQFTTLEPGDLIATGTPGGVGAGRKPPVFLRDGQRMVTAIDGLGALSNHCVAERAASGGAASGGSASGGSASGGAASAGVASGGAASAGEVSR
jgi:acylpyruvate hydrolase